MPKIKKNSKLILEIQRTKNFKNCQDILKRILRNLVEEMNDFDQSKNIHDIINLAELNDIKKGNWEKTKIDKFMEGFLVKNKFELELAKV